MNSDIIGFWLNVGKSQDTIENLNWRKIKRKSPFNYSDEKQTKIMEEFHDLLKVHPCWMFRRMIKSIFWGYGIEPYEEDGVLL